jgi:hypothetical protein
MSALSSGPPGTGLPERAAEHDADDLANIQERLSFRELRAGQPDRAGGKTDDPQYSGGWRKILQRPEAA